MTKNIGHRRVNRVRNKSKMKIFASFSNTYQIIVGESIWINGNLEQIGTLIPLKRINIMGKFLYRISLNHEPEFRRFVDHSQT